MTRYTPKYLEEWFKRIAFSRMSQSKSGKSEYKNDAGYWTGGRCAWGGTHNLAEDCQKLSEFFSGVTELKNFQKQLTNFNNQQAFEKNKQELLIKIDDSINGLQMKTSNTTSIGGVCIIWNDFKDNFDSILGDFRKDLDLLKKSVESIPYSEFKELQKIKI